MKKSVSRMSGRACTIFTSAFVGIIGMTTFILPKQSTLEAVTTTAPPTAPPSTTSAPPSVNATIASPAANTYTNVATVTVSGTATASGTTVASVTCTSNGATKTATLGTGTTSRTYTCAGMSLKANSANTISVIPKGANGATKTVTVTCTHDGTAPGVTISVPAAGAVTDQTSTTVSGTVTDNFGTKLVKCGTITATLGTGTTSRTFSCAGVPTPTINAINSASVVATDNAANASTPVASSIWRYLAKDCNQDGVWNTEDSEALMGALYSGDAWPKGLQTPYTDSTPGPCNPASPTNTKVDNSDGITLSSGAPTATYVKGDVNFSGKLDNQDLEDIGRRIPMTSNPNGTLLPHTVNFTKRCQSASANNNVCDGADLLGHVATLYGN